MIAGHPAHVLALRGESLQQRSEALHRQPLGILVCALLRFGRGRGLGRENRIAGAAVSLDYQVAAGRLSSMAYWPTIRVVP